MQQHELSEDQQMFYVDGAEMDVFTEQPSTLSQADKSGVLGKTGGQCQGSLGQE